MMSLIEQYETAVKQGTITNDLAQREVIIHLQRIITDLDKSHAWYKVFNENKVKGLYIMGQVGVGKTYLMDLFYTNLVEKKKARFHFHLFMQQIDKKLRELQGHVNPIAKIVKQLAKNIKVLCLDEFLVNDVAYAMILSKLLAEIFARKIVLVITTNTEVDDLYIDGVGRKRFLEAINLLKENCEMVKFTTKNDYRLSRGHENTTYYYPLNSVNNNLMLEKFANKTSDIKENSEISILNRPIHYIKAGKDAIWFDFNDICNTPRCQLDYLEIVNSYKVIFISEITQLSAKDTIKALLLMHLVDVAYDRGVLLIISSEVAIDDLYKDGELAEPFIRTKSRLNEMQSIDYLTRHAYSYTKLELG